MSIIDKIQKNIKSFSFKKIVDELFWFFFILFVALASFSFGARYERNRFLNEHPISIRHQDYVQKAWESYEKSKKESAKYFASKNGTVFYPLACPSGDRITQENRVFFETKEQALSAGYKASLKCF